MLVGQFDDFYAAVLATHKRIAVVGDWARGSSTLVVDRGGGDAGLHQHIAHGSCTALGQLLVVLSVTGSIAVANHEQTTLLKLFGGGFLVGSAGLGVHLRQLADCTLAVFGELVRVCGKHAAVFDLGD
ncbi:hypothetical protein D3C84_579620 [compost metagenome]